MFSNASSFNQNITYWGVSNSVILNNMFEKANKMISEQGFNKDPEYSDFNKVYQIFNKIPRIT